VTSCRATAHQSVTQALRSIAEAPGREAINRFALRPNLNVVPDEGLTPVAPVLYGPVVPGLSSLDYVS
jgi:hypothetical protein